MAASTAPAAKALHLSLFAYLIKRRIWLAGIGLVVVASVCQAVALATGPVALVQPIFIIELPFTLLVASKLAHRKLPRMTWYAVALVTVALGAGLAAAAPSGGSDHASIRVWTLTLIVTGAFQVVVIGFGVRAKGNARAAAFGLSAACGYALTATLMKSAVSTLDHQGIAAFFSAWELYGTAAAGVGALFMLQNALQAGSLVAVQPPLTLGDAIISACYGVAVFGEDVQTGGWLLAVEIVAVIAIAIGCIELSRSLAMVHVPASADLLRAARADRMPGRGRTAGRLAPARRRRPPGRPGRQDLAGGTGPRGRDRGAAGPARAPRPRLRVRPRPGGRVLAGRLRRPAGLHRPRRSPPARPAHRGRLHGRRHPATGRGVHRPRSPGN